MIRYLLAFDTQLFYYLNVKWHCNFLDMVCPYLRDRLFWIPLYVFIFSFLIINFKRKGLMIILFLIITIMLSDQISSAFIKPMVQRIRPCNLHYLESYVRILVPCNNSYSFPSSHAANHFALAIFLTLLLRKIYSRVYIPLIIWALIVCYSQIYVGVHFPLDIIGGAILGSSIGMFTALSSRKILNLEE
jgi:membrane-associated phospholipid phosphatase